jgi:hypothetical protein
MNRVLMIAGTKERLFDKALGYRRERATLVLTLLFRTFR